MIKLKKGTQIRKVAPQMVLADFVVEDWCERNHVVCFITSGDEPTSVHMVGSLHYLGLAHDFRTRDLPPEKRAVLKVEVAEALGSDYDVILEVDHLHVEFDPKVGQNAITRRKIKRGRKYRHGGLPR